MRWRSHHSYCMDGSNGKEVILPRSCLSGICLLLLLLFWRMDVFAINYYVMLITASTTREAARATNNDIPRRRLGHTVFLVQIDFFCGKRESVS